MNKMTWLIALAVAGLGFVIILSGCDKDDDEANTIGMTFHGIGDARESTKWIVIHSADGSEILGVKEVPESGDVVFDEIEEPRVSVTTVNKGD